jgi:long-chain acyl-CoA synthetase
VVPRRERGEERVHAVLILSGPDADAASAIRAANEQLESHQRIQSWSLWPGGDFPRTTSTMKIKRKEVSRQVAREAENAPASGRPSMPSQQGVRAILGEITGRGNDIGAKNFGGSDIPPSARLAEDLGLSSLQRVELLARIENDLDVELDEERFAAIATV